MSDESVLREVAQEAGLDADAVMEVAWNPTEISGLRLVREEALRLWVRGVPTVTISADVLYPGAAEPRRLLASSPCWPGGRTPARFEGVNRNVYTQDSLQVRQNRGGRLRSVAALPRLGRPGAVRSEERR